MVTGVPAYVDGRMLDMVDAVCRTVRQNGEAFGCLQVILVGDFFQLPPVLKDKGLYAPEYHFAFQARVWKEARSIGRSGRSVALLGCRYELDSSVWRRDGEVDQAERREAVGQPAR